MGSRENSRRRARSEISRAPFGFTRAPGGTLAPHAEQASIVAEAFAIGARDGLHAAADYLADALPERRWTTTTTRRLLSNRTYLGEVRYGDQVKADAHEPLVSLGTFTLAQSQPNGQRRPAAAYPLSGLARCRTCGSTMVGARTGKSQRGYRCGRDSGSKRAGVKRCPRPAMVLADSLDAYVKGAAVILSDRDSTHGRGASVGGDSSDALAVAERAMTAAEGELIAFTSDATARQKMGDRAWSAGLDARARARDEAHAAYAAELKRSRPRRFIPSVAILAMPPEDVARVLRDIFRAVIVKPGRGKLDERVTVVPHEHLGDALVNHLRRKLPGAVVQGADAVLSGSPLDQILAEDAAGVGEPKP